MRLLILGRTLARPDMWTTGPFKSPKMIYYGNPVINITDLRGTYSIKGYRNLHIVNVEDKEDVIPIEVIKLRDHFLKSGATVFGKLSGSGGDNIKTVAIWDSTEMLENNFAILHHIGENVYLVEWIQLFEAYRAFPAVLASERVRFVLVSKSKWLIFDCHLLHLIYTGRKRSGHIWLLWLTALCLCGGEWHAASRV